MNVQILKIRERESTERVGWPSISSKKILMTIISVFRNIDLETHNAIESIKGVGAA